jgi:hypothetical protein
VNALFIYDAEDLDTPLQGGVQICSREYLAVVKAAADSCALLAVKRSRRMELRIRRKMGLGSYLGYEPELFLSEIAETIGTNAISHVFLNQTSLAKFAPLIKGVNPKVKVVVMSHGNQSGDDLYEIASPKGMRSKGFKRLRAILQLGQDVVAESLLRHDSIDLICVMSREEAVLESWLGTANTLVLPRTITSEAVTWEPIVGRVGYVGTLDHTPNKVALEDVFEEIARRRSAPPEIRLVGRPTASGVELASQYPFVRYLGALSDADLRAEARTWSLFLNPILWLSRGASMKLGVAIGWGLPILTTDFGARGYEWGDAMIPFTRNNAGAFVNTMEKLLGDSVLLSNARQASIHAESKAPTALELARRLRKCLDEIK